MDLESIEGSWKNSQESLEPKIITDPTSVGDRANAYKMPNSSDITPTGTYADILV